MATTRAAADPQQSRQASLAKPHEHERNPDGISPRGLAVCTPDCPPPRLGRGRVFVGNNQRGDAGGEECTGQQEGPGM